MEEVSCPDNINSVYCLLSGHETLSTEFSNATEIHCIQRISLALNNWFIPCRDSVMELQV